jgi:DNA-binding phage protein
MTRPSRSSRNLAQQQQLDARTEVLKRVIAALGGPASVVNAFTVHGTTVHRTTVNGWKAGTSFPGLGNLQTLNAVYLGLPNQDQDQDIAQQLQAMTDTAQVQWARQQARQEARKHLDARTEVLTGVIAALGGTTGVSNAFGITRQVVNGWKAGTSFPGLGNLQTLNAAYGVLPNQDTNIAQHLKKMTETAQGQLAQQEARQRARQRERKRARQQARQQALQELDPRIEVLTGVIAALGGLTGVSNALGISRQAVRKWKAGTSFPGLGNLQTLNDVYRALPNQDTNIAQQLQEMTETAQGQLAQQEARLQHDARTKVLRGVIAALGGSARVAHEFDIDSSTVSNWNTGTRFPGNTNLNKLNAAYGVLPNQDTNIAQQLQAMMQTAQPQQAYQQAQPPDQRQILVPTDNWPQDPSRQRRDQRQSSNAQAGPGPGTLAQRGAPRRSDSPEQHTADALPSLEALHPAEEWRAGLRREQALRAGLRREQARASAQLARIFPPPQDLFMPPPQDLFMPPPQDPRDDHSPPSRSEGPPPSDSAGIDARRARIGAGRTDHWNRVYHERGRDNPSRSR